MKLIASAIARHFPHDPVWQRAVALLKLREETMTQRPSPWEPEHQYETPPRRDAVAYLKREAFDCLARCKAKLSAMGCDETLMDRDAHELLSDELIEIFHKALEECDSERETD